MRIAITGAGGQLGQAMVRGMSTRHTVSALTHADLDIACQADVFRTMAAVRPQAIVNCAAYNAVDRAEDDVLAALNGNAFGVQALARAAAREDVTFYGEYLEVDPPKGFTWTFMFDVEGVGPMGGPESFTFEDLGGKTKVTSVGHMRSVEELEGALSTGMVPGALQTWDRLAAVLAEG